MRISDWSSDVCSSDLQQVAGQGGDPLPRHPVDGPCAERPAAARLCGEGAADEERVDRKSVVQGKSVSVRVDLGGRRLIKKKTHIQLLQPTTQQTISCRHTYQPFII